MPKKPEKPLLKPLKPGTWLEPGISLQTERLIGRVVSGWSQLEDAMQDTLWALLNVPLEDGRILTSRTDATRKIQWLRAFATRHLVGDELTGLTQILDRVELVQDDRNFIAHGTWGKLMPDGIPTAMSIRAKSLPHEIVSETFPPERMREIAQTIYEIKFAIIAWKARHEASRGK